MQTKNLFTSLFLLLFPLLGYTQAWKWAQSLGDAGGHTSVSFIRKYNGDGMLTGGLFGSEALPLGAQNLQNAGQEDGYIALMDANGQYTWATRFGGTGRDAVVAADAAPNGEIAVAGHFNSLTMTIEGNTLLSSGETDVFVVKYHADKSIDWVQKIGSADIDQVVGIQEDGLGNTYIAGQVINKVTQSIKFTFLQKRDNNGNLLWERKGVLSTGFGNMFAGPMALGADQSVYVSGTINGFANFNGLQLSCDTSYAAYIIKYSPDGVILDSYLNPAIDKFNDLKIKGEKLYVCAEKVNYGIGWGWPLADASIFVLQFDTGLTELWRHKAGGKKPTFSLDIAKNLDVDAAGNVYVTGSFFSDSLRFGSDLLFNVFGINYFYPQIFVFKYSPTGQPLWAKSLGSYFSDEGTSICVLGDDTFYLGGQFESDPVAFGTHTLHNPGTLQPMYVHLMPDRYFRNTVGFVGLFDKTASGTRPEPGEMPFALSPNPSAGPVSLQWEAQLSGRVELQVYSSGGRLLRTQAHTGADNRMDADLSDLTPGVYFIRLRTEKGVFTRKLMKI